MKNKKPATSNHVLGEQTSSFTGTARYRRQTFIRRYEMKLTAGFSIAVLMLLVGGCSQGDGRANIVAQPPPVVPLPPAPPVGGGDPEPPPQLDANCEAGAGRNGARGGIWFGRSPTSDPGQTRLLVAETGEFRWISASGWDQQIRGTFRTLGADLTSDDAIWVWVAGLTWMETQFAGVEILGEFDDESNLSLSIQSVSDPNNSGTLSFSACNSVYTRGSSLASLAGTYVNGNRMLAIDGQGEIFLQDRTCVGNGSAELIDPGFNMYRMELTVSHCAGNEVHAIGSTFSGLAYLGDSDAGFSGDLLEFSLSAAIGQRFLIWADRARK